jgi:hypothetical protein
LLIISGLLLVNALISIKDPFLATSKIDDSCAFTFEKDKKARKTNKQVFLKINFSVLTFNIHSKYNQNTSIKIS